MCAKRPSFKSLDAALVAIAVLAVSGLTAAPAFALWPLPAKAAPATPTTAQPAAQASAQPAPAAAKPAPRKATPQERAEAERMDPLARAAFWGREFQANPTDAEAGVSLSNALRAMSRYEEAMQVSSQVLVAAPKNVPALLEEARAMIGAGRPFYAIDPLKQAQGLAPKDWRPVSLLAMAYEQTERPDEALIAYKQALVLSPDNPAVMSNLALFYAGRGDPAQAETLLRRVVAQPNTTVQERQNLALVLGLQGKLAEAERLMRQDLPPETVNNNLAYFRTAAATTTAPANAARTWGALEGMQAGQAVQKRQN